MVSKTLLRCTSFRVYIYDLCGLELENGTIVTYADETAILFCVKSRAELYNHAQKWFNVVTNSNWTHKNLGTNIEYWQSDKTKCILFTMSI